MTLHVMSDAERIAYLEAQVQRLQASQSSKLRFKVSDKGGVSVYGIHSRFPVTLYRDQWARLFGALDQLKAFIEANADSLSSKTD